MPNGWRTINSLVHKIRLHGRRGKGMAESFSRQKSRHAPQKEGGLKILCDLPPVWPRLVRPLMSRMDGKKTHKTHTVPNLARGLLNREKRTKEKVWQHNPPTPHTACSEKINKITRRIYRRYAGLGRSRVRTRIPSARRLGLWVWLRKILHSRLR